MGSFYGGGAILSGSMGGSSFSGNYNDLTNVPVKNLVGSESNPIDLSSVDTGIYKVEGPFKYGDEGEINTFASGTEVYITTDKETNEKVSIFYYVENGELKAQIATYSDPVEVKDVSVTGSSCECNNNWIEI